MITKQSSELLASLLHRGNGEEAEAFIPAALFAPNVGLYQLYLHLS